MSRLIQLLRFLEQIDFWSATSTFILLVGSYLGWRLLRHTAWQIRDLYIYVTWKRNADPRFPLILHFEFRNLSQGMIVISSPYFVFDAAKPGLGAHKDSATGKYEIKFRRDEKQSSSEVACILRHRDVVTSYVALEESQTDEELLSLSESRQIGRLFCDIIFLDDKPRVRRLELRLAGVEPHRDNRLRIPVSIAPVQELLPQTHPDMSASALSPSEAQRGQPA